MIGARGEFPKILLVSRTFRELMEGNQSPLFVEALNRLVNRGNLGHGLMQAVMEEMIGGKWADVEMAALLAALRVKGETAEEIAAAALVLRRQMIPLETGRADVLDTCGTGGDGTSTFNISTAAALVAAGAGVPVVKHGNRAVSSHCGSADVLASLGVKLEARPEFVRLCLERAGLGFCFAPHFHPAMRHVGPVRRRLKVRTLFNCLGPLANPARAPFQLMGIGRPEWLDPLAQAMALLGTRHTLMVCGRDGLDEVSLSGPTLVRDIRGSQVSALEWTPADFGLEPCSLADLQVAQPEESAACIRQVLRGEPGPALRVVVANAAAALLAVERVGDLAQGVRLALASVAEGKANEVLEQLIACSQE